MRRSQTKALHATLNKILLSWPILSEYDTICARLIRDNGLRAYPIHCQFGGKVYDIVWAFLFEMKMQYISYCVKSTTTEFETQTFDELLSRPNFDTCDTNCSNLVDLWFSVTFKVTNWLLPHLLLETMYGRGLVKFCFRLIRHPWGDLPGLPWDFQKSRRSHPFCWMGGGAMNRYH